MSFHTSSILAKRKYDSFACPAEALRFMLDDLPIEKGGGHVEDLNEHQKKACQEILHRIKLEEASRIDETVYEMDGARLTPLVYHIVRGERGDLQRIRMIVERLKANIDLPCGGKKPLEIASEREDETEEGFDIHCYLQEQSDLDLPLEQKLFRQIESWMADSRVSNQQTKIISWVDSYYPTSLGLTFQTSEGTWHNLFTWACSRRLSQVVLHLLENIDQQEIIRSIDLNPACLEAHLNFNGPDGSPRPETLASWIEKSDLSEVMDSLIEDFKEKIFEVVTQKKGKEEFSRLCNRYPIKCILAFLEKYPEAKLSLFESQKEHFSFLQWAIRRGAIEVIEAVFQSGKDDVVQKILAKDESVLKLFSGVWKEKKSLEDLSYQHQLLKTDAFLRNHFRKQLVELSRMPNVQESKVLTFLQMHPASVFSRKDVDGRFPFDILAWPKWEKYSRMKSYVVSLLRKQAEKMANVPNLTEARLFSFLRSAPIGSMKIAEEAGLFHGLQERGFSEDSLQKIEEMKRLERENLSQARMVF